MVGLATLVVLVPARLTPEVRAREAAAQDEDVLLTAPPVRIEAA